MYEFMMQNKTGRLCAHCKLHQLCALAV